MLILSRAHTIASKRWKLLNWRLSWHLSFLVYPEIMNTNPHILWWRYQIHHPRYQMLHLIFQIHHHKITNTKDTNYAILMKNNANNFCRLNWCDSGWWWYQPNTDNANMPDDEMLNKSKLCQLVAKYATYRSGAIWWRNLQPMQVVPSGGQICYDCKWRHLVAKFTTNACDAIWWSNFQLMQVAPSGGWICN